MKILFVLITLTIASTSSSALAYEKWSETPTALKIELAAAKTENASLENGLKQANTHLGEYARTIIDLKMSIRYADLGKKEAQETAKKFGDENRLLRQRLTYTTSMSQIGWALFFTALIFVIVSRWWYRWKTPKQDERRPQT